MMKTLNWDLWAIILARLPLKSMTACKLVCNEWKSILESSYLRELFLCQHQNSYSSWSLLCSHTQEELLAHYGCENWGLSRSLGSYTSSFLTDKFGFDKENIGKVRVVSYTDIGLILICLQSDPRERRNLYVANPISRECVEIPPPPPRCLVGSLRFSPAGLATQVGNGVVLGYKVVMINLPPRFHDPNLLIYSSETGLWSFKTLHSSLPLSHLAGFGHLCLNGSLYWFGNTLNSKQVIVTHDFYAAESADQCQVILFPDSDKEPDFNRGPCTTSQGFLMYMHISLELKLSIWRLERGEWQLVSQISPTDFDYVPLAINPFDSDTLYLQMKMNHSWLASTHLHKKGNLDHRSDCGTLSFAGECDAAVKGHYKTFHMFLLPRWLYRMPS